MLQLKGGGGKPKTPPSPTNTPDNLRSEDTLEAIFGVTEGPWKGLTNGHKSFMVGDTVLQRQDGGYNFQDFEVITYPGNAFPDVLKYRLGGESNNFSVNVPTVWGVPLTRQTAHGNIDFIDIRLLVNQLLETVEAGKTPGTFDATFEFRIRYKPASASQWAEWGDAAGMNEDNPYFTQYDSDWSDGTVYNPQTGEYIDMGGSGFGKIWNVSKFNDAVNYWRNQPGYTPSSNTLRIRGKTSSAYTKEYRIPVQRIPEPYQIQIQRLSPNSSNSSGEADARRFYAEVTWESFQTIDVELKRYPYTGFIQIIGKATDQFSSIPQFSGEGDGLIVKVPTNYNPYTRTYTGTWDGNFKEEWTNNPVWILYEAMHNDRWGWSTYSPVKWSRYEAYELAQVCDFKLPNGQPRYTFNAYITDPMDGREFCRYIAGSFNSIIVDDDNGNVQVLMDKDDPAIQLYGPESIIGDFEYTYTDVNTRFNDLTVVFRNPEIDYAEDRRRVFDQAHIDQHGRIPYDFVAVGTTNDNEAVRKASRRLVSATTETEQVNFKTNRKASYLKPYDIILITDPIKGYGLSGRFKSYSSNVATLRDPVYLESGVTYGVDLQTSAGVISMTLSPVQSSGFTSTLTFTEPLSSFVDQKAQFSLKDANSLGLPKPYRVLDVHPEDEEQDQWAVFAIEINRNKFAAEDDAEIVGEPIYTSLKKKEPAKPKNLLVTNATKAAPDGTIKYVARVDFTPPDDPFVTEYWVRYRKRGEYEYTLLQTDGTGFEIELPVSAEWEFQVQSRNLWEQQSPWISTTPAATLIDKVNLPTGGSIVSAVGGLNQVTITVLYPDLYDIRYARIYASKTDDPTTSELVAQGDTKQLIHSNIVGVQTYYYWAAFEDNLGLISLIEPDTPGVPATTTQITSEDFDTSLIQQQLDEATAGFQAALEALQAAQQQLDELVENSNALFDSRLDALDSGLDGVQEINAQLQTLIDGKASTIDLNAVISRQDDQESVIGSMSSQINDLPNKYVLTTTYNTLKSEIENARGTYGNLSSRFTAQQTALADGLAGKASASDLTNLQAVVTGQGQTLSAQGGRLTLVETEVGKKASVTDVTSIQAVVSTRGRTYYQLNAPVGTTDSPLRAGDLWINTNDNRRLYAYTGSQWVVADDQNVQNFIGATNSRLGTVEVEVGKRALATTVSDLGVQVSQKVTTYRQNTDPPNPNYGDILIKPNTNNGFFRYEGPGVGWVGVADERVPALQNTTISLGSRIGSVETATVDLQNGKASTSKVTEVEATANDARIKAINAQTVAATADGKVSGVIQVALDSNGRVIGTKTSDNGVVGSFIVTADVFGVETPGNPADRLSFRGTTGLKIYKNNVLRIHLGFK